MYSADWDAADYFPTFMRFFVYKPSLLATLSCPHVETGAKLGAEAIESVANANARSTLWEAYRTLFWSDYDLTIYEMEDRRYVFSSSVSKPFKQNISNGLDTLSGAISIGECTKNTFRFALNEIITSRARSYRFSVYSRTWPCTIESFGPRRVVFVSLSE